MEVSGELHALTALIQEKSPPPPGTHRIGGLMAPRTSLETVENCAVRSINLFLVLFKSSVHMGILETPKIRLQNYTLTFCFIWVWNLVCGSEFVTSLTESIRIQCDASKWDQISFALNSCASLSRCWVKTGETESHSPLHHLSKSNSIRTDWTPLC
jgi:hypothetical protein